VVEWRCESLPRQAVWRYADWSFETTPAPIEEDRGVALPDNHGSVIAIHPALAPDVASSSFSPLLVTDPLLIQIAA
jgi:hypothetical protein